ncbi:MAG: hypothetical protein MUC49_12305 [Raineya sp.]|jgi:hypothetical protein|nr:hypothetical protein [Raineya sp.]
MKIRLYTIFTIFFVLYLSIVLCTKFSWTGYWTDVIFSIILVIFALWFISQNDLRKSNLLKRINQVCIIIVLGIIGMNIINPLAWDNFKLRSFYFQRVKGRVFNAYFRPVGSYGRGYGWFYICETPKYFPIIEWEVYRDGAVNHDFRDNTFDGQPIDNYEMVRSYIEEEVIKKHQDNSL